MYRRSSSGARFGAAMLGDVIVFVAVSLVILIMLALAGFQIALAAGAPFGRFAWGGAHRVLPVKLRLSSLAAVAIYAVIASFPSQKAGLVTIWPAGWIEPGLWVLACYLAVGAGLNVMSKSRAERMVMTPTAAVLAILFFIIALI